MERPRCRHILGFDTRTEPALRLPFGDGLLEILTQGKLKVTALHTCLRSYQVTMPEFPSVTASVPVVQFVYSRNFQEGQYIAGSSQIQAHTVGFFNDPSNGIRLPQKGSTEEQLYD